ncbi:hypothetical protein LMG28614_02932 [Paraburkholderia ultramafica]|uniref:Uncharacterized protein n=1 Tax=Paraburkholderia ultramafica TaxID=1544867 RepID=A0A6S7B6R8_9BURK|nr:hypothetical protein [Paraburkholderia ultramafica]CAB3789583.1 hypothetical protein LMG28614_02932 [Paraburkholderia ultramafica]
MSIESNQPLLKPIRLGELILPNRVVMAPLTRMRAANPGRLSACAGMTRRHATHISGEPS